MSCEIANLTDGSGWPIAGLRRDAAHAFLDALGDAAGGIIGRGGNLPDLDPSLIFLEHADVGNGAAGIHAIATRPNVLVSIDASRSGEVSKMFLRIATEISAGDVFVFAMRYDDLA